MLLNLALHYSVDSQQLSSVHYHAKTLQYEVRTTVECWVDGHRCMWPGFWPTPPPPPPTTLPPMNLAKLHSASTLVYETPSVCMYVCTQALYYYSNSVYDSQQSILPTQLCMYMYVTAGCTYLHVSACTYMYIILSTRRCTTLPL